MINTFAFLDDFCLQQRHQLKRRFFTLKAIEDSGYNNPLQPPAYSTIQYVSELDRYYMFCSFNTVFSDLKTQSEQCIMSLAESEDGIHYHAAEGTLKNFPPHENVVFAGLGHSIHGPTVLYDPDDPDPARRFKCAGALDEPGRIMAYSPCTVSVSPDGKNWSTADGKYKWSNFWSDSYNALIWNPVLKCYQIFCRAIGTDRRICTVTSKDLVHWTEPQLILHPDTMDGPNVEFYAMPVHYYQGIFYGFLWIYQTDEEDTVPYKMAGRMRCELVYSYNGLNWNRTYQPVADHADYEGENYGTFNISLYNTILNREKDLFLTVGSMGRFGHGDGLYCHKDDNHLPPVFEKGAPLNSKRLIFSIKPGRYCGLESIGNSGRLRTKIFFIDKDGVMPTINAACPYGEMRVQLCKSTNEPIPGFTFADCIPFRGNELAWKPLWKNRRIEEAAGKFINMQIELQNACIFGISGSIKPFHGALPLNGYGDVAAAAKEVWGTMDKAPDYDALEVQ